VSEEVVPSTRPSRPAFAHASEAELARILSYYDVRWEYEPDTFPIGWTLDGQVVESFSPDFYLPDLDLYIELTTLRQSLVRKKNRKLRRLRELYPDVRIKLFYARDFRMLLLKFGRLALAEELSGATGQSTPPRGAASAGLPQSGKVTVDTSAAGPVTASTLASTERRAVAAQPPGLRASTADRLVPGAAANADARPRAVAEDVRTPRGRRRGRRRPASAPAGAQPPETPSREAGVTLPGSDGVASPGPRPS
jgi:hypothetical protein